MVTNPKKQSLDGRFVVFDIETTGFSPLTCKIIEIGAVLVENGKITDRFSTFVNPQVPIPFRIEQLTSINDSMVMDARPIEEILPEFLKFCEGATTVSYTHLDVYKRQGARCARCFGTGESRRSCKRGECFLFLQKRSSASY